MSPILGRYHPSNREDVLTWRPVDEYDDGREALASALREIDDEIEELQATISYKHRDVTDVYRIYIEYVKE